MFSKKCIFIGGKQIAVNCLKILLENNIRPELVIPNLDDTGDGSLWHESFTKCARDNGLETLVGKKAKDPEVIAKIREINPDIIFCFGGTQLIPAEILAVPKEGTLNIHPALLPKYRGRYSTVHALFNGETETGATLHYMNEGLDSGPIISQKKFPITENDTARTLWDAFTETGTDLFRNFLPLWLSGAPIPSYPQNEAEATYYPKGLPNDGKIDWSWDGHKIKRFIRAMTFEPFPPADFTIGDAKEMVIIDKKYFKGFD